MATCSSSTMKTSLVLLLLLSAVVSSQAHQVSCKNTCKKPIALNGVWVNPGATIVVNANAAIVVWVYDVKGVKHVGNYNCPGDVYALVFLYADLCLKVKVTAVSLVGGLLHTVLGLLTTLFSCNCNL